MKQVTTTTPKLSLQKKTIKKLSTASMTQILGGKNISTNPVTVPPTGTH
jgi:hypothetical protein